MTAPTPEIVEMAHQFLRFSVISGSPVSFNPPDLRALLDHVATVTAERDQARSDLAKETDHCRDTARSLRQITARWDQARQMLADAPHSETCAFKTTGGWLKGDRYRCTCWKAGL